VADPLELKAWSRLDCDLSHSEAASIRETGLVDVVAEPAQGRWRIESGSRVGVAIGATWELRVEPRIEVPQLLFLLAYALDPNGWKDEVAGFSAEPRLLDAIAAGFSWHALRSIEQGLLRGYLNVDERSPAVRGRIRFGDQITRLAALPLPLEVSYDDYTADIVENRILKSATLALLRLPRIPGAARRRLHKLRAVLDGVSFLDRPRELEMPTFTRLNRRYRSALCLAQLILRGASLNTDRGPVDSVAFAFDMNRVFEDFLTTALHEAFQAHGGELRSQFSDSLDVDGRLPIRPDVTWWVEGTPLAVVDAKHKQLRTSGSPGEDAYQMLAYCTALDLRRGYLVYAADSGAPVGDLVVRNSACEICIRTVDIRESPELLLREVEELASEIVDRADWNLDATLVAQW
jgi:5-methylcytosine-specific restriction enzyme subunit McrC